MLKVIFLDVDGVLNRNSTTERFGPYIGIDLELVENLKYILEETGAKIVLSSTWRLEDNSTQAVHDAVGSGHFIGKTISLGRYGARPTEVQEWIGNPDNPEVDIYCILDDDFLFHTDQKHFRTTWDHGLSKEIAQKVVAYLNGLDNSDEIE